MFSFPNHNELLYSAETRNNPLGLLELTPAPNCDRNIICFPAQKKGVVQIVVGSLGSLCGMRDATWNNLNLFF